MGEGTPQRAGPRKLKLGCGGVGEGQAGCPSVPLSRLCWGPQSPSASTAQDSMGAGVGRWGSFLKCTLPSQIRLNLRFCTANVLPGEAAAAGGGHTVPLSLSMCPKGAGASV